MNEVIVKGQICDEFKFSHRVHGVNYYSSKLIVNRESGVCDLLPIVIKEDDIGIDVNSYVEIHGSFRSHNKVEGDEKKLVLFIYADDIFQIERGNENCIIFDGTICKKDELRKTPKGRIITDVCIAINNRKKSYYIPCVSWGSNAYMMNELNVGDKITIIGRIQSREYIKNNSIRTAYEVSIQQIKLAQNVIIKVL